MMDAEDKGVAAAERALFAAVSSLHNYGRPVDTAKLVDAIRALIELKIAVAIEQIADRVQDASGIRP